MKQKTLIKEFCKDANYYLIMFDNDNGKEFGKIIDNERLLEDGNLDLTENEIYRSIEDREGNRLFVLDLKPKDRQFIDNPLQLLMTNLQACRALEKVYPKIFTWVYDGLVIKGYAYVPSGNVKANSTISRYGGTENFIKVLRQHLKNIVAMKNGGSPDYNFLNIDDRVSDTELSVGSINKRTHQYSIVIDPSMTYKNVMERSKDCTSRTLELNTLNMKYWAKEINPDFITEAKHVKLEKPLEMSEDLEKIFALYPMPIKRLMALKDKGNYNRFLLARFLLSVHSPKDAKFIYYTVLSPEELEHVKGGNCKTQWNFIMNNFDRYSCPSMKELAPFIREEDEKISHPLEKIQDYLNSLPKEDKE